MEKRGRDEGREREGGRGGEEREEGRVEISFCGSLSFIHVLLLDTIDLSAIVNLHGGSVTSILQHLQYPSISPSCPSVPSLFSLTTSSPASL